MAKNTQSNATKSALELFLAAGIDEIDHKGKAEKKGSSAYMQAILAADDGDTRAAFHRHLTAMNDADEKVSDAGRAAFAQYIGAEAFIETTGGKERKTQDYRNLMKTQALRMTFALDIFHMGVREFVIITEKGVAFIKGGSKLAHAVWKVQKWNDKPNVKDKRAVEQDISLVQRASDRNVGEISWAMLADVVASENGRKVAPSGAKPVTVNSPATSVLQLVKDVMKKDNAVTSLSSVESRMLAWETVEDIAAFVIEGDDMIEDRKALHKIVESVREKLQSKINAKVKLQNAA